MPFCVVFPWNIIEKSESVLVMWFYDCGKCSAISVFCFRYFAREQHQRYVHVNHMLHILLSLKQFVDVIVHSWQEYEAMWNVVVWKVDGNVILLPNAITCGNVCLLRIPIFCMKVQYRFVSVNSWIELSIIELYHPLDYSIGSKMILKTIECVVYKNCWVVVPNLLLLSKRCTLILENNIYMCFMM